MQGGAEHKYYQKVQSNFLLEVSCLFGKLEERTTQTEFIHFMAKSYFLILSSSL